VASSFVYRQFDARHRSPRPSRAQRAAFHKAYPDALLLVFPMSVREIERDLKWLGSHRFGIVHLGGADDADLRRRCELASTLLGWTPPYADCHPQRQDSHGNAASPDSTPAG
jgi:hypothetical protein